MPTYRVIRAVPGLEYLDADPTAATPRNPAAICLVNQPAARDCQPIARIGSRSAICASALPAVTSGTLRPGPATGRLAFGPHSTSVPALRAPHVDPLAAPALTGICPGQTPVGEAPPRPRTRCRTSRACKGS